MSNNNKINFNIDDDKILDGTNYRIWYDTISTIATGLGLSEYLEKNKISEAEAQNPDDSKLIKLKWKIVN